MYFRQQVRNMGKQTLLRNTLIKNIRKYTEVSYLQNVNQHPGA